MWRSVLPHVIWAGVVLFMVHELKTFAKESRAQKAHNPLATVEVPDDLVAYAMQEREAWAQEEVLRAVRERYEELRDWNKVRSAVGIGRIDG